MNKSLLSDTKLTDSWLTVSLLVQLIQCTGTLCMDLQLTCIFFIQGYICTLLAELDDGSELVGEVVSGVAADVGGRVTAEGVLFSDGLAVDVTHSAGAPVGVTAYEA